MASKLCFHAGDYKQHLIKRKPLKIAFPNFMFNYTIYSPFDANILYVYSKNEHNYRCSYMFIADFYQKFDSQ